MQEQHRDGMIRILRRFPTLTQIHQLKKCPTRTLMTLASQHIEPSRTQTCSQGKTCDHRAIGDLEPRDLRSDSLTIDIEGHPGILSLDFTDAMLPGRRHGSIDCSYSNFGREGTSSNCQKIIHSACIIHLQTRVIVLLASTADET